MFTKLPDLEKNIKSVVLSYLIVLGIGMTVGLFYVYLTSEMNPTGMTNRYLGNDNEWEPTLAKTLLDLVSHAHDHITMFSIVFFTISLIFNQTTLIIGKWKKFIMIEPFFSIIITFMGFFVLRYVTSQFAYVIMIGIIGGYVWNLFSKLTDVESRISAVEKNFSKNKYEDE